MRGHAKEMREETREHAARLRSCCSWVRGNANDWRHSAIFFEVKIYAFSWTVFNFFERFAVPVRFAGRQLRVQYAHRLWDFFLFLPG